MDPEELNADQGGAAPELVIEPTDTPAEGAVETAAPEGAEEQAGQAEPAAEAPKHKVPQSVQKRIDKLSYDAKTEREGRESAEARIAALEALLAAQGGDVPQADPAKSMTQDDVQREAAALVARQSFDQKCNTAWEKGEKEFGATFDDNVGMLRALGVMQVPFIEAVMETASPERVLNALGADPDEAVRIASLPPIRQAIELDRMATKLATPAKPQISKVPAPLNTLDGSGKGAADIYDANLSDEQYYAIRAKEREQHFAARR